MKKKLILLAAMLPMAISGCQSTIKDEKGVYTLKDKEMVIVEYMNYMDSFTTKSIYCNQYSISGEGRATLKGEFTIQLVYLELGLDVKVSGIPGMKEANFTYRGNISYHIVWYQ